MKEKAYMCFRCIRKDLCPICEECLSDDICNWGLSLTGLLKASRLPSIRWSKSKLICEEDDKESFQKLTMISKSIYDYAYPSDNNNILIYGSVGNGKTSWAIRLLQSYLIEVAEMYFAEPKPVAVFIPTVQFLSDGKSPFGSPFYDRYIELSDDADAADIVVWDDIGRVACSDYDYLHLFTALERRFLAGRCNIFTTNCTKQAELANFVGNALASRIWNQSEKIKLVGRSRRGV